MIFAYYKHILFDKNLLLLIINIIVLLICILESLNVSSVYKSIVLIPIFYVFLFLMFRRYLSFTTPGIIMINIISFFRYAVTPMVILLTEEFNWMAKNYLYIDEAIIIIIIEMIAIFVTIALYNPLIYPRKRKNNSSIFLIALSVAFILFFTNKSLTGNLKILDSEEMNDINAEETSGFVSILWQMLCVYIYASIILYLRNWKGEKIENLKLYISLFCCLLYLAIIFTGQYTISRWYSIVTLIASIFWLMKLYPNKTTTITLWTVIPAGVVLTIATILKNTLVGLEGDSTDIIGSIFNATSMDTYFAGPVNVNSAIGVNENTEVGIESAFEDIFNNFPVLNHFLEKKNASVHIYNNYLARTDQILPLVGQSFIWFGYLFTPLLSIFSVVMVKRNDSKYSNSYGIKTYLYAFVAIWCAIMPILNFTIWMSWVYLRIVPAFLLFHFACVKYNIINRRNNL